MFVCGNPLIFVTAERITINFGSYFRTVLLGGKCFDPFTNRLLSNVIIQCNKSYFGSIF